MSFLAEIRQVTAKARAAQMAAEADRATQHQRALAATFVRSEPDIRRHIRASAEQGRDCVVISYTAITFVHASPQVGELYGDDESLSYQIDALNYIACELEKSGFRVTRSDHTLNICW